jgi:hypothetical protein
MLINSTKRQMIAVAAIACGFAVGMAGLLNYFKYRSTSNRIHHRTPGGDRTFRGDRGPVGTRSRIDIFGNDGKLLYSTESQRSSRPVPAAWLAAVAAAHSKAWMVDGDVESAAGMSLKTSFGVTLAHLAFRYSGDSLRATDREVAGEIALKR